MRESSLNKYESWPKSEIFSKTCIPPETLFFVRLDGWKFRKLSETIETEKPFDERFAKCLVLSAKVLFKEGLNPTLVYVVSDELNILFMNASAAPFGGRIEKTNSVLASLASSACSLNMQKFFGKTEVSAFDSRVVITSSNIEKVIAYMSWRQMNAWRNHNNAYAYWTFRKMGHKPAEIAKKLKGLRTKNFREIVFEHGVDLAKTPSWQRKGILVYKQPFFKRTGNNLAERWKLREDWNLPLFTSKNGTELVHRILACARQKGGKNN